MPGVCSSPRNWIRRGAVWRQGDFDPFRRSETSSILWLGELRIRRKPESPRTWGYTAARADVNRLGRRLRTDADLQWQMRRVEKQLSNAEGMLPKHRRAQPSRSAIRSAAAPISQGEGAGVGVREGLRTCCDRDRSRSAIWATRPRDVTLIPTGPHSFMLHRGDMMRTCQLFLG
jgi:hypothetical protein